MHSSISPWTPIIEPQKNPTNEVFSSMWLFFIELVRIMFKLSSLSFMHLGGQACRGRIGREATTERFRAAQNFFFYCGWKSFSLAEVCKRVGESTATAPLAIKLMGPWIAWAAWSNEGQRRSKTTLMISGIGLAAVEGREEMGSIGTEEVAQWEKVDGDGGGEKEERILVSVRLRPLNAKEIECNDTLDWECISNSTIIFKNNLPDRSMHPTAYTFDRVFGCNCSTKDVYMEGAKEVALSVVSGINATIFAYGQTSSGKTYTMTGLTEYSVEDIYDYIKRHEEREFILKFSAMEIYNEAVRDLLSMDSTPLRLLDDQERGTIVEKLAEETLRDQSHFKELLSLCEAQRQIGETSLNEMSSRSHQILRLTIESSAKEFVNRSSSSTLSATVNFVDLAGSERASQSLSVGARLKEGCHINRSLLTLGTVIRKLSKGTNGHIPYRDSKLTRILQSSLGGNARTAIICTMSPAHSHVEQSRNTLFFANCAKQVVTNAQVNVVMSDKALVKHLQKKLARLESELRYPGAASCISHFEALRDKDSQIEKMEREIKELIQQRDLAQSQFEDLLRAVGDDQASRQWDELSRSSISHARNTLEDVCSISGTSCIGYQSPDFGSASVFPPDENNNQSECEMEHFCKLDNEENVTPSHSASSPTFSGIILQQRRAKTLESSLENSDDHCREVRCIEIHALSINKNEEFIHSLTEEKDNLPSEPELADEEKIVNPRLQYETCTGLKPSEEQPSEIIARTVDVVKLCLNGSSQRPTMLPAMTPKDLVLTRSRSCNSKLMFSSPSFRYSDVEQNHKISPNDYMNEFPGNLDCGSRKVPELEYHAEFEAHSHEESQESERFSIHDVEAHNNRILAEEDMTNVTNHLNEVPDDQDVQQKLVEDYEVEGTLKDVGIDSASFSVESPSRWPFDFERKQQEIIELWHACNVSLIHRTYFFLLVNGDPADSFYMEVEHRRLSFLRKTSYHRTSEDSHSVRYLRREREMLCRQMLKKLSPEERITLYTKWGIALNSKRRRMQLACLVWTNTGLTHVRDSASIVAKLVRPLEQGQDLKEMFGLSFIPKQTNHRYFSWKHTKSSLT